MRKLIPSFASLCALAFVVATSPAQASNVKSFVASNGSDSNACTQTAPCLTFAHAIAQTSAGGEIDCLTGGDFGPVTISNSITIDCGAGHTGGIGITSGTAAISINLGSSGTVILRNLELNGLGGSSNRGIDATSFPGGALIVQHCNIHSFPNGFGIYFNPTGGRGLLEVSDTAVYGNDGGIAAAPDGGIIASVVLNRDQITANTTNGFLVNAFGTVAGAVRQSVLAENAGDGIYLTFAPVYLTVEESSIVDNLSSGIQTQSSQAFINVGASTIGGNATGVNPQSGAIYTFGNNQMSANGSNGSFTPGGPGLE